MGVVCMTARYPELPFSEYRFLFKSTGKISFSEYTGSMWRGAFGHALRKLSCCSQTPHLACCVYSKLFEPSHHNFIDNGLTKSNQTLPVPYVFRVQRSAAVELTRNDWFSVDLVLIASANEHIELVIEAMKCAGRNGLGKTKGSAELVEVVQSNQFGNQSVIYADGLFFEVDKLTSIPELYSCDAARLHFLTPINLSNEDKEFSTTRFLMGVVRRVSLLQRIYGHNILDVDYRWLKQLTESVNSNANVWVAGWNRHSTRKKSFQPVKGWMGEVFLQGEALHHLWPYLYLGQWLHTGKMTNIGLGRYQLQRVVVKKEASN